MRYRELFPGNILKHYVQCYFTCESEIGGIIEDKVFASGYVEIMFNLGAGGLQKITNGNTVIEPAVQLWGQTIQPLSFTTTGTHSMLGIRFLPHTAACFFDEPIETFNGQVTDFIDIAGKQGRLLYMQLLEAPSLNTRIELLEKFLLARLARFKLKFPRLAMVNSIMRELNRDDFFENLDTIAIRYGISSRYLQKLFIQHCGLSPNLYSKINRFQKSLQLVAGKGLSLTAIAYECGYYDQSHFIKDFKYFTGFAPSHFYAESSTDFIASLGG